jgi:glycosyltransferase involved in cell wall biosynthesis
VAQPQSQLRVLHICQRDDPATGGAARVAVEFIKRLPDHNIDAHCLFLYGEPSYFQTELGDRAHYLHLHSSKDFLHFDRLRRFIHQFQPHILHHHDGLAWSQALTFFHPNIIKIAHAHLPAPPRGSRGQTAAWLQKHSTNLLLCITQDTQINQIDIGGYPADKTQVLYNGVDLDRFQPTNVILKSKAREQLNLPQSKPVIGFVGRLHSEMKGVDDFLRVIHLLPPDYHGLIVGDGPDRSALQNFAHELGISDRVRFTGLLQTPAMAYQAMDIFCLTSHWEPFGLVVAEAMACQVPVIGFECPGGIKELLCPDTGVILRNRELSQMAKSIIDTIEHPEQSQIFCHQAYMQLQTKFDWEKNAYQLSQIYQTLIQSIPQYI